jgi:phage tail-like protein
MQRTSMQAPDRQPLTNMRFRIDIEGMRGGGALEVIFPSARIVVGPRKRRAVQYGMLTLRRGLTRSSEWYDWWCRAHGSAHPLGRIVLVVLLDDRGADVIRWTFAAAKPLGYLVSNLNALGNEALIESLEMSIGGFQASFAAAPRHASPQTAPRKR